MTKRLREPYYALKKWLRRNHLSQLELAETLKTSSNYINKKINGTGSDFRLSEVRLLVSKYSIPVDLFFVLGLPESDKK
ncbi:hypothetical protein SAMN05216341_105103 [Leuconostocaceae bacterium R-53105]|uniref:Helix-turn-helix protein n=1 Tax=Convivina intestini TaxID=1505726 RepID=A0A2U1D7Y5_9LACO|nr:hypothetical protein C7384_106102 [Convivina intestini]CAH1853510.1 hypothetical protein R078131_00808 [Convivina intestini]CAH1854772.1 hypothetical protein R077811_00922 [Convivina intestini]SDB93147.1 hypothetical protein SAMN05216341_105103 [Leuconostocaceae bacterium R-53105]